MRAGSLFSGIGGFDLGFEWAGIRPAWQVEKDEWCRRVLAKHWPNVKRYGDIHEFIELAEAGAVEPVDLVAGGPPCQPASVAGKRQGAKDDRWLWPEALRAVAALRPTWCLFENPVGFRSMGLDDVLSALEGMGYATQTLDIPACGVGAPHRRHRLWILGHSGCQRRQQESGSPYGHETAHEGWTQEGTDEFTSASQDVADPQGRAERSRLCQDEASSQRRRRSGDGSGQGLTPSWWAIEPDVCGMADGISGELDGDLNADKRWLSVSCEEAAEQMLRTLWNNGKLERSSSGRGYYEQFTEQYPDLVHALSHGAPLGAGEASVAQAQVCLRRMREALNSRSVRNASLSLQETWESLLPEEKDWVRMGTCGRTHWDAGEWPGVPRVATGVKNRGDRLRALGNAVIPQIPYIIGKAIMGIEGQGD